MVAAISAAPARIVAWLTAMRFDRLPPSSTGTATPNPCRGVSFSNSAVTSGFGRSPATARPAWLIAVVSRAAAIAGLAAIARLMASARLNDAGTATCAVIGTASETTTPIRIDLVSLIGTWIESLAPENCLNSTGSSVRDNGTSMRILLVEDDPRLSALLERGFKEEGHVVDRTASGSRALDALEAEEFDVVVLDVMLPELDGFGVVRQM